MGEIRKSLRQRRVYILRGIPGSGKTTLANFIAECYEQEGLSTTIVSADQFMVDSAGNYLFDWTRLKETHDSCFAAFREALNRGVDAVFVDNVNQKVSFFRHYAKVARELGYEVVVVQVPHCDPKLATARNSHGVPLSTIQKMIHFWEPCDPKTFEP